MDDRVLISLNEIATALKKEPVVACPREQMAARLVVARAAHDGQFCGAKSIKDAIRCADLFFEVIEEHRKWAK